MGERSVAIVTGGNAGIGAAICRHMIEAGSRGRVAGTRPAGLVEPDAACDRSGPKRALPPRRPPRRQKIRRSRGDVLRRPGNSFITGQVLYVCGGTGVASISF
jgi:NAD(P)-dependent dehydrogenase (short-subunit alcohol dehydrogenase family)